MSESMIYNLPNPVFENQLDFLEIIKSEVEMATVFNSIPEKYVAVPDFADGSWSNYSVSVNNNVLSVVNGYHSQNRIIKSVGASLNNVLCKLHIDSTSAYANISVMFMLTNSTASSNYYNEPLIENHDGFGHYYSTDNSGISNANRIIGDTHTGNNAYIKLSPEPAPTSADILYMYTVQNGEAYVGVYSPQCGYGWAKINTGARHIIFGLAIYQGTRTITVNNLYYES